MFVGTYYVAHSAFLCYLGKNYDFVYDRQGNKAVERSWTVSCRSMLKFWMNFSFYGNIYRQKYV